MAPLCTREGPIKTPYKIETSFGGMPIWLTVTHIPGTSRGLFVLRIEDS